MILNIFKFFLNYINYLLFYFLFFYFFRKKIIPIVKDYFLEKEKKLEDIKNKNLEKKKNSELEIDILKKDIKDFEDLNSKILILKKEIEINKKEKLEKNKIIEENIIKNKELSEKFLNKKESFLSFKKGFFKSLEKECSKNNNDFKKIKFKED